MAAIELHGLTKRYGDVTAVDDLTLERGRLVISAPLAELTAHASTAVVVRTPEARRFRRELVRGGIRGTVTGPDQVTATGTTPEAVGGIIGAAGIVIHEMRLDQPNLEDVFLTLTGNEGRRS